MDQGNYQLPLVRFYLYDSNVKSNIKMKSYEKVTTPSIGSYYV